MVYVVLGGSCLVFALFAYFALYHYGKLAAVQDTAERERPTTYSRIRRGLFGEYASERGYANARYVGVGSALIALLLFAMIIYSVLYHLRILQ
jgi:hypothetical protein